MNPGYLFILAFLFSVPIYWLIKNQSARNIFITIVSILFVYMADKTAFTILILMCIYTYLFSLRIIKPGNKPLYHKISVAGLVIILATAKYAGYLDKYFLIFQKFLSGEGSFESLLMPLGLSYITFKHISYLTDVYWGLNKRVNLIDIFFYSSFFTIFLSGPIERYDRIDKQINTGRIVFSSNLLYESIERISYGSFKKFVIADWIGYFIMPIWRHPDEYSFLYQAAALIGFSFQIYFDFSGYSDIAIGTSRAYGIKIMENFNYPCLSQNISQFWRNWHISLSDWIRDYLFFPLSKLSNNKVWALVMVPLIAMGICGMWHGSEIKYLYWGLYHGAGISVYQIWNQYKRKRRNVKKFSETKLFTAISLIVTFAFVTIGWMFFR